MSLIVSSPLLLDNEALRDCLRVREAGGLAPARGLRVPEVVKPASLAVLAGVVPCVVGNVAASTPGVQVWPDVIRQLHWELSSSTTLRPLANLMGKAALLPDPWNLQGGLRAGSQTPAPVLRQHPHTRLYTILRVDVLLSGSLLIRADETDATPEPEWTLSAGDMLILTADLPVRETLSGDACVWTVYYYSPDPCCCKAEAGAGQREVGA